ncbi:hypothetical protein F5Y03DRAFT_373567 [Xylaria venustula]|nr:hypothetical protein F5Y03DRAFT_373567 [Xylaria venustula]
MPSAANARWHIHHLLTSLHSSPLSLSQVPTDGHSLPPTDQIVIPCFWPVPVLGSNIRQNLMAFSLSSMTTLYMTQAEGLHCPKTVNGLRHDPIR